MKMIAAVYLAAANLLSLLLFGVDKYRAVRRKWRISERTLLLCAFLGGSAGAFLGMLLFRHKIRRGIFRTGLPLLFILQACLLLILLYFRK